jgi:hypothetical protein
MRSMRVGFWVACGVAAALAAANVVTMKRLWASQIFERSQKIAQSVLLWLIPGSFALVRHALEDHLPGRAMVGSDSPSGDGRWSDAEGPIGGHGHGGGDLGGGGGGDGTVGGF